MTRTTPTPPRFVAVSRGGHFKGQDPTVPVDTLQRAWADGVEVVYIGKATAGADGRRGLGILLDEYRRYGDGQPVGHRGGRYIWQLAADQLLVAWLTTPGRDPGDVGPGLINAFTQTTGRRPLANLNRDRRRQ